MKILVTGSTGFIGCHVVDLLLKKKHEVKAFCRSIDLAKKIFGKHVEISKGDILNINELSYAVRDCDYIIHLAGYAKNWSKDPSIFHNVNVKGTQNVLDSALKNGVKKVVITSTQLTIPPSENGSPNDEGCPALQKYSNPYQESKCIMEKMIESYVKIGLHVVIVNPTRVFGPGVLSEANSVTKMIKQYMNGSWRLILSDGMSCGNYAYVSDVAQGHLLALSNGKSGERYLLGGKNLSFNELFAIISEISGKNRKMLQISEKSSMRIATMLHCFGEHFGLHPPITPDWIQTFLQNWEIKCDQAIRDLDYQITPFTQALEDTIIWLEKNKGNKNEIFYKNNIPCPES